MKANCNFKQESNGYIKRNVPFVDGINLKTVQEICFKFLLVKILEMCFGDYAQVIEFLSRIYL